MTYALVEVFYTLQGEGYHTGTPALFIRFAGCSMWSGKNEHRHRDAVRNAATCPLFCDTDFLRRQTVSLDALITLAETEATETTPLVVLTGGEPLLQIDDKLIDRLRLSFPRASIAVETNGVHELPCAVDWICVSPKLSADLTVLRTGDELKIVVPAYSPESYLSMSEGFTHLWVSAEAGLIHTTGKSLIVKERLRSAANWVMQNPGWRLTLQAHKMIGIR